MKIEKIAKHLSKIYPDEYKEDWDFPGLIVGSIDWETDKILYTVDITEEIVNDAIENGCNLIFSHHPLFFRSVHNISDFTFRGKIVNKLLENKIALYVGHTNVDKSINSASKALAEELGLYEITPIEMNPLNENIGLGAFGVLPESLAFHEFAERVTVSLLASPSGVRCSGDSDAQIKSVAICSGSGDFMLLGDELIQADVYITSDLRHHPVLDFRQEYPEKCIIDVPHWVGEHICLDSIRSRLESELEIKGIVSKIPTDPFNFVINK
ncbi:MAG: Nif3-like dinuclear metal center hexameric protein [Bifidobacteriaceae bacterium]|jgi:dinuclear metal center YbgI/SA1388 family protein|nr:Nif3-like dinuclear metal center hexameric protein [Bifidobacteriaceae bacterium]